MKVVKRVPTTFRDLSVGQLYMYGGRDGEVFMKLSNHPDKNEVQVVGNYPGNIHFERADTHVIPVEITELKEL